MLRRYESFDKYLDSLSSTRRKVYRQRWKRLQRAGSVEAVLHLNLKSAADLATRFMDVEKRSWKGEQGSALAEIKADSAFFSEITAAFGERDQLFFVELKLNNRTIAKRAAKNGLVRFSRNSKAATISQD